MEPRRALVLEHSSAGLLVEAIRVAAPSCVVRRSRTVGELVAEVRAWHPEVVCVPAGASGVLTEVRAADPAVPLVAVAETGDVDAAAEAAAAGASDFLVLGPRLEDRVRTLVQKLEPVVRLRDENRRLKRPEGAWALLGDSAGLRDVRRRITQLARVPRPVLVTGERGTGKELVAHALHEAGGGERSLVVVNCAAFSDALLESELFGHEKGAYTGADRRAPGKFELASGGTLFLDEIACMSLAFQQKVLRVVEYGVFTRVGGTEELTTTARVVAATNADLEERIGQGVFLADLYDRLAFDVIRVPALRERKEDIAPLARHFVARFCKELPELGGRRLTPAAVEALERHPFPGNVRELKHLVERAALRGEDGPIDVVHLELDVHPPAAGTLDERVDAYRRSLVERALRDTAGNQAAAARALGITYDQLRHWVRSYRIASGAPGLPARGPRT